MKKVMIALMIAFVSTGAFAKGKKITKKRKHAKVAHVKVIPMRKGQKTIVCGKAGETMTVAIANINKDLAKPQVKSATARNLTVNRPFSASAPIVHSEKRKKKMADVYVACVKVKKT